MAETIQLQLASIAPKLVRVWHYEESSGVWQMYDPTDPIGSDLAVLVDGEAYWIMINAACTINYTYSDKTYNYPLIAVVPAMSYLIWGTGVTDPPADGNGDDGNGDDDVPGGIDITTIMGPLMMVMMMGMIMPMISGSDMFGGD